MSTGVVDIVPCAISEDNCGASEGKVGPVVLGHNLCDGVSD
jgi:hypothetical protein